MACCTWRFLKCIDNNFATFENCCCGMFVLQLYLGSFPGDLHQLLGLLSTGQEPPQQAQNSQVGGYESLLSAHLESLERTNKPHGSMRNLTANNGLFCGKCIEGSVVTLSLAFSLLIYAVALPPSLNWIFNMLGCNVFILLVFTLIRCLFSPFTRYWYELHPENIHNISLTPHFMIQSVLRIRHTTLSRWKNVFVYSI